MIMYPYNDPRAFGGKHDLTAPHNPHHPEPWGLGYNLYNYTVYAKCRLTVYQKVLWYRIRPLNLILVTFPLEFSLLVWRMRMTVDFEDMVTHNFLRLSLSSLKKLLSH